MWEPSGWTGSALSFNGSGSYAEALGYRGITGTSARTLALWIRIVSPKDMDVCSWGAEVPGGCWNLSILRGKGRGETPGTFQLSVNEGSITRSTSLTDDQWHHLALVLEASESPQVEDIQLYVDGRPESPGRIVNAPIDTIAHENIRFGLRPGDTQNPFRGSLDDIRLYSRALSPSEILLLAGIEE